MKQYGLILLLLGIAVYLSVCTAGHIIEVMTAKEVEVTILSSEAYLTQRLNYIPKIEYAYDVDGETYRSSRLCSKPDFWILGTRSSLGNGGRRRGRKSSCYTDVKKLVASYEADSTYTGYYNPGRPSQSFLIPGFRKFTIFTSAAFILLCLFAAAQLSVKQFD